MWVIIISTNVITSVEQNLFRHFFLNHETLKENMTLQKKNNEISTKYFSMHWKLLKISTMHSAPQKFKIPNIAYVNFAVQRLSGWKHTALGAATRVTNKGCKEQYIYVLVYIYSELV